MGGALARLTACSLGINTAHATGAGADASSSSVVAKPEARAVGVGAADPPDAAQGAAASQENVLGAANGADSTEKPKAARPRRHQEVIWRGSRHKTKKRHTMLMRAASEPRRIMRAKAKQAQADAAEQANAAMAGIVPGSLAAPRRSSCSSWVPTDDCAADNFLMQLQKRATVVRSGPPANANPALYRG